MTVTNIVLNAVLILLSLQVLCALIVAALYKENCKADTSYAAGDPGNCVLDSTSYDGTHSLSGLLASVSLPNVFSGRCEVWGGMCCRLP